MSKKLEVLIVGNGAFGTFLKEVLAKHCVFSNFAKCVILAVPEANYEEVAQRHAGKHLVNVCSVQQRTTDIVRNWGSSYTSIHPLYGKRTLQEERNAILTDETNSLMSRKVVALFKKISPVHKHDERGKRFNPESHDRLMRRVHAEPLMAIKTIAHVADAAFAGATDEAAFFQTDSTIPGLTGTMKYKDVIVGDDNVTDSAVTIDLVGNKLTKQQIMSLCKLLVFESIVPMNSE